MRQESRSNDRPLCLIQYVHFLHILIEWHRTHTAQINEKLVARLTKDLKEGCSSNEKLEILHQAVSFYSLFASTNKAIHLVGMLGLNQMGRD